MFGVSISAREIPSADVTPRGVDYDGRWVPFPSPLGRFHPRTLQENGRDVFVSISAREIPSADWSLTSDQEKGDTICCFHLRSGDSIRGLLSNRTRVAKGRLCFHLRSGDSIRGQRRKEQCHVESSSCFHLRSGDSIRGRFISATTRSRWKIFCFHLRSGDSIRGPGRRRGPHFGGQVRVSISAREIPSADTIAEMATGEGKTLVFPSPLGRFHPRTTDGSRV